MTNIARVSAARVPPALVLLLTVAALSVTARRAEAHAALLHAEPAAGARLAEAPAVIRLYFNERVEPVPNSIRVTSLQQQRMDSGEARLIDQGQGIEVSLPPLDDGPYAVFWRVHSVDGHHVRGEFGFGVNADAPDSATVSRLSGVPEDLLPRNYFPALKWASLLGVAVWLGGLSFLWTVLRPAAAKVVGVSPQHFFADTSRRLATILTGAAAVFVAAEVLTLVGHSAAIADTGLLQAARPSALAATLVGTNYGHWWIVRMAGALALFALARLALMPRAPAGRDAERQPAIVWSAAAAVLGAAILFSIPLTGHARAVPERVWLAVFSDGLHLAATAIWIGGLLCLAVILVSLRRSLYEKGDFLSSLARRFSGQAAICVALLLATGAYNTWLHLPGWSAFLTTDYGRMLLLKGLLIIPLLAIAARNRFSVLPSLASQESADRFRNAAGRLHRLVRVEAIVGVAILGVVAVLTNLSPATAVPGAAAAVQTRRAGDYLVSLQLTPQQTGSNRVVAWLRNDHGDVLTDARRVTVFVNMLDMDMGLQTIQAQPAADGSYTADVMLSMAGLWRISVEVSPARGDTFVTEFDFLAAIPQSSGEDLP